MNTIYINTDGGARGNPGPAAIGIIFFDIDENELFEYKECIGCATNNQAEYKAIIKAIELLKKSNWYKSMNGNSEARVLCRLDSELVVRQILGQYKIKNDGIKELSVKLKIEMEDINIKIEFEHIKREKNKKADKLVNNALDQEKYGKNNLSLK